METDNRTGTIYCLKFPNGKVYIGQTWDIKHRHMGLGSAYKRQFVGRAIEKHGWNNIERIVLQEGILTQQELDDKETDYINTYKSSDRECGYNCSLGGFGRKGLEHTEETKEKIGRANTGKKHTEETKKRLSEIRKRMPYNLSDEGRKKIIETHRNRIVTEETRKKLSDAGKGRVPWCAGKVGVFSEEALKKMSEASTGRKHSEETLKKIGEASRGRTHSEESRKKISEAGIGRKLSEETKRKLIDFHTGRKRSEETKRRISEAKKKAFAKRREEANTILDLFN